MVKLENGVIKLAKHFAAGWKKKNGYDLTYLRFGTLGDTVCVCATNGKRLAYCPLSGDASDLKSLAKQPRYVAAAKLSIIAMMHDTRELLEITFRDNKKAEIIGVFKKIGTIFRMWIDAPANVSYPDIDSVFKPAEPLKIAKRMVFLSDDIKKVCELAKSIGGRGDVVLEFAVPEEPNTPLQISFRGGTKPWALVMPVKVAKKK